MTDIMKFADEYAAVSTGAVPDVDRYKIGLRIQEARAALQSAIEAMQAERDALQAKLDAPKALTTQAVPWRCINGEECQRGWQCSEVYCQEHCVFRSPSAHGIGENTCNLNSTT